MHRAYPITEAIDIVAIGCMIPIGLYQNTEKDVDTCVIGGWISFAHCRP